ADGGMKAGECPNRGESSLLNDTSKSLDLVNYFRTLPLKVLHARHEGGGTFQAVDLLNGERLCGCNDVHSYADGGMKAGECPNRGESSLLNDTSKSLVLVNYFRTLPLKVLHARGEGGGTFQAVDLLNEERLCGCNDVHSCVPGGGSCTP
nr:PI-PLC X domain-containing protein At5g67130 [Tanacetum cinerariifolium]